MDLQGRRSRSGSRSGGPVRPEGFNVVSKFKTMKDVGKRIASSKKEIVWKLGGK